MSTDSSSLEKNNRGLLVVIDGVDGSGKTTQVKMLYERLLSEHFPCVASSEPTQGQWGKKLRRSAFEGRLAVDEELDVICNDRLDDVRNCIAPSLVAGKIVVLDRYYTSTLCYQVARGLSADAILARNREFAPTPDLIFILDIAGSIAVDRIHERGEEPDKFETSDLSLIADLFASLQLPGLLHVDARRPKADIHSWIYTAVVANFAALRP